MRGERGAGGPDAGVMNPEETRRRSSAWWVAVATAPVLVAAALKVQVVSRPYWSHYFDPETIFFYDGVRLAHGLPPVNVDHPGAPTQLLSALLVLLTGDDPLGIDRFRHAGYVLSGLLLFLGAFVLHRALLDRLEPVFEIAALWAWFSFPTVVRWTSVWTTEALCLPFGALALAAAWRFDRRRGRVNAALLGASLGLLVSLKFLFLSWLPAGVILVLLGGEESRTNRVKQLIVAATATIAAFVALTLPSVSRYPYMASWFWKLASRSGEYGSGSTGLPTANEAAVIVIDWVATAKGWSLLFSAGLVWLLVSTVRERRRGRAWDGAALFALTALVFSSLAVFRANGSGRYMLPSGLAAFMVFSLALFRVPAKARCGVAACAMGVAGLLLARSLVQDHSNEASWAARGPLLRGELANVLARHGLSLDQSNLVYSFRFPDPAFALRIMTSDPRMYMRIEEQFPRTGHYNPWTHELHLPRAQDRWDALVIMGRDVPSLPFPVGRELGRIEDYIVLAPSS